ncbi:involucrin-like isoform X2 [Entelurus aequoreus]|uniref:involucrin-like isoform X2 n=1 Tax=Entelurus aequoreus TaxID=161455 RepID=UPI002B1D76D7|nr:involucrin-like isoform X2 [Entelurus aequoreus]
MEQEPQPPHIKKEEEELQLPQIKAEEEPHHCHINKEYGPQLSHFKKEKEEELQPPQIKAEEEPQHCHIKREYGPQLSHFKKEKEEELTPEFKREDDKHQIKEEEESPAPQIKVEEAKPEPPCFKEKGLTKKRMSHSPCTLKRKRRSHKGGSKKKGEAELPADGDHHLLAPLSAQSSQNTPENAHWRETLRLLHLQQRLLPKRKLDNPQQNTHR